MVIWFQNNNISRKQKKWTQFFKFMWKTYGEIQVVSDKGISKVRRFKSVRHVAAWDQLLWKLIYPLNLEELVTSKGQYKNKPVASVVG